MPWPSAQLTVRIILFYSRVYDCVRMGYVLSRKKALEKNDIIERQVQLFVHKSLKQPPVEKDWRYYRRSSVQELRNLRDRCSLGHFPENDPRTYKANIECPIPDMSRALRFYSNFSLFVQTVLFINYVLVCLAERGWFDAEYLCLVPGRLTMSNMASQVPSVSAGFAWLFIALRFYTHFYFDQIDLDCFSFLMYTEEQVRGKEREVVALNQIKSKQEAYEKYIDNSLFFRRVHRLNGQPYYRLKPHRTVRHWRKLKKYIDDQSKGQCIMLSILMAIPAVAIYRSFSHEVFEANYPGCHRFALHANVTTGGFHWSFKEPYRLIMSIIDFSLNISIGVDIPFIILFVAEVGVVVTNDLDYRLADTCERIDKLNAMLVEKYCLRATYPDNHVYLSQVTRDDENVMNEILSAQDDIIDMFEHVALYDNFIRQFAATHIFFWFYGNIGYQLISMFTTRNQVIMQNPFVHFGQVANFIGISVAFYQMSRPCVSAERLYHKLCKTAALDPYIEGTKRMWTWIFEFYDENSTKYSLHFIEDNFKLSFVNYVQSMSWFISCSLYALNLVKYLLERR